MRGRGCGCAGGGVRCCLLVGGHTGERGQSDWGVWREEDREGGGGAGVCVPISRTSWSCRKMEW